MEGITNNKVDDEFYCLKLEGNLRFEDVYGPDSLHKVTRKEFLVRVKDVLGGFPNEAEKMLKRIHKESGATIAITCSSEVMLYFQARMELWGTADQVKVAESAIIREITKLYHQSSSFVPTILMQAPIYHNEVYVSVAQCVNLVGVTLENVVKMEAETGAWIVVEPLGIYSPHVPMRRLNIFGNREQVYRVLLIVNEAVLEPYKPKHDDMVQDHQLLVDSNNLIKEEQTVKLGNTEYDVFLKKIQSVKQMKSGGFCRKKFEWREYDHKLPAPRIYRPTSPAAYIFTSHDPEISFLPSLTSTSNPPDASYNSPRPTPPSYRPTSPAYIFTSHVYIPRS